MSESRLLKRVEAMTGPDREIDAFLHVALVKPEQYPDDLRYYRLPHPSMDHMETCALGTYWLKQRSGASLQTAPKYTDSVDAVIALSERVLQGWSYGLRCSAVWADHHEWAGKPVWEAIVANPGESDSYEPWCDHDGYNEDGDSIHEYEAKHWSPALALLAALLKASPEQSE